MPIIPWNRSCWELAIWLLIIMRNKQMFIVSNIQYPYPMLKATCIFGNMATIARVYISITWLLIALVVLVLSSMLSSSSVTKIHNDKIHCLSQTLFAIECNSFDQSPLVRSNALYRVLFWTQALSVPLMNSICFKTIYNIYHNRYCWFYHIRLYLQYWVYLAAVYPNHRCSGAGVFC